MRFTALAFLVAPIALAAVGCGRSALGSLTTEEGGGGAGGGSTTSTTDTTTTPSTTTPTGPCGNGVIDPGEQCDDGNASNTDACLTDCVLATCGDGIVHVGFEQCDDANDVSTDDCVSCAVAFCGDGFVHAGFEQCDDGNATNGDGCSSACQLEGESFCGDGVIDLGEECDDGNTKNGDGCSSTCQVEVVGLCGDGVIEFGEQCDDGNTQNGDGCSSTCQKEPGPTCGNGMIEPGEQCDDGNAINTDACLSNCVLAVCGDGVVHIGFEQCDDANNVSTDACVSCAVAFCGDGFVRAGVEQCDDGNNANGDGCSSMCAKEMGPTCGNGVLEPGEQCDDGNASNTDGCLMTCKLPTCGDGFVQAGVEECDDANNVNTDSCVIGCKKAKCGDGFVHTLVEQCDDGNLVNGDGCSSTCQLSVCGDGVVDPNEACDLGPMNADRPAFRLTFPNGGQSVKPIVSPADASLFYNYFSASGHTGFEVLNASIAFLYVNSQTKALSLFLEHGIDFTTTGQNQAAGNVKMDITGLPAASVVALSDDSPMELFKQSATTIHGDWQFNQNTDGGIVSGLPFPGNWTITITPTMPAVINQWLYVDGGATPTNVSMPVANTSAQIQAFDTPSACRLDCTVPKCGDGVLDGGEVCDDGNVVSGDGCAADCKGF